MNYRVATMYGFSKSALKNVRMVRILICCTDFHFKIKKIAILAICHTVVTKVLKYVSLFVSYIWISREPEGTRIILLNIQLSLSK